jgi:hypothetical protein
MLVLDLDLFGPRRMAETMGQLWLSGTWTLPDDAAVTLAHTSAALPGPEPETVLVTHLYDLWSLGQPVRRTSTRIPMALLGSAQVEGLLFMAGFHLIEKFGSYALTEWDEEATRVILVAQT